MAKGTGKKERYTKHNRKLALAVASLQRRLQGAVIYSKRSILLELYFMNWMPPLCPIRPQLYDHARVFSTHEGEMELV